MFGVNTIKAEIGHDVCFWVRMGCTLLLQVLLVEHNSVVRHCLLLYLQQLGMAVKAVSTEDQAITCLRLQGKLHQVQVLPGSLSCYSQLS